ncbi:hypothetical protein ANANG_G00284500 [Anguilla anguilla]|uniref:Rho GTPase activating protein 23 n=1 Tax=Anguilla anguilla TaxID=7936 RepID=A0A9D3LJ48_ANGAN|nr:hypothetical protein ANANG_G00284500 [Anguilla anguilla]
MTGKQKATGQTRGRPAPSSSSPHHYPNQNAGHAHGPALQQPPAAPRRTPCSCRSCPRASPRAPDPCWAGLRSSRARSENQLAAAKLERRQTFGRSLEMLDRASAPAPPRPPREGGPAAPAGPALGEGFQRSYYGAPPPWWPAGAPAAAAAEADPRRPTRSRWWATAATAPPSSARRAASSRPRLSGTTPPRGCPSPGRPPRNPAPGRPGQPLAPCSASPLLSAVLAEPQDGRGGRPITRGWGGAGGGAEAEAAHGPPLLPPAPPRRGRRPSPARPRPRRANGALAHLPLEDDSLATIPFIGSGAEVFSADEPTSPNIDLRAQRVPASSVVSSAMSSAPTGFNPAFPPFSFPLQGDLQSGRRSSYLSAVTTERSKSCDEGLNSFRDDTNVFSRLPKRVKSFFADGSLDSLLTDEGSLSKRHSASELGSFAFSDVLKEGWLQYKQIVTEKGRKVGSAMRPWKRAYSVLRSNSLFLYKDKREALLHGAAAFGVGGAEDEQPISIRGCLVDIAYSETKRKHALRLATQDYCEYLLQAEDREDMLGWIRVIRENSKNDSEDLGVSGQALINKKLNDYRKQSPTGGKPDTSPKAARMMPAFLQAKPENAGGSRERREESSPPKAPWGISIMKRVKKAGPKAFGVRLEDCQPAVNNKFVPLIVEICCGLVEDMGLEYTGIYRVPGNNAVVSSLQEQLNKGVDINPTEEKWQDLNVVSSLLKSFFRKLPEPLFTDDKYNDFIDANRMENAEDRLKTMRKLIHDLPDCYYHTLKFLVEHLKTVADNAEKNKMEPRNLALVFGPTLVRTSDDNMTDMVTHMPDRYKIVETLIQHCDWFFSDDLDKDEKTGCARSVIAPRSQHPSPPLRPPPPVETVDLQPAPNIDHLLPNIGRTCALAEASDSTNSDSKSKGSWGSKRELSDFLSIMSAVGRTRKKRPDNRLLGSSTDEDSEQEPNRAAELGGGGGGG